MNWRAWCPARAVIRTLASIEIIELIIKSVSRDIPQFEGILTGLNDNIPLVAGNPQLIQSYNIIILVFIA